MVPSLSNQFDSSMAFLCVNLKFSKIPKISVIKLGSLKFSEKIVPRSFNPCRLRNFLWHRWLDVLSSNVKIFLVNSKSVVLMSLETRIDISEGELAQVGSDSINCSNSSSISSSLMNKVASSFAAFLRPLRTVFLAASFSATPMNPVQTASPQRHFCGSFLKLKEVNH